MIRRCLEQPVGATAAAAAKHRAVLPRYDTERLTLRPADLSDFPAWRSLFVPDADGILGGPHSEEEAWEAFCVYVAGWLLHGHGAWAVELKETRETAGFVLLGLEWGDLEPELGWMLLPEYRGKGIAFEAASAARAHANALIGDGGFVSYVARENTPSNALAARLGAHRDTAAEARLSDARDTHIWRHGGSQ